MFGAGSGPRVVQPRHNRTVMDALMQLWVYAHIAYSDVAIKNVGSTLILGIFLCIVRPL